MAAESSHVPSKSILDQENKDREFWHDSLQLLQVYKGGGHDDASIALLFLLSSLSSALLGSLVGSMPFKHQSASISMFAPQNS